jgi:hypothetical protein
MQEWKNDQSMNGLTRANAAHDERVNEQVDVARLNRRKMDE